MKNTNVEYNRFRIESRERYGVDLASHGKLKTHVESYDNRLRFALKAGARCEINSLRGKLKI